MMTCFPYGAPDCLRNGYAYWWKCRVPVVIREDIYLGMVKRLDEEDKFKSKKRLTIK